MKAVWNIVGKIVGKILLIIVLATIVMPIGYLAWRAFQPMELPQFNGLTYYEYLNWRKNTLHQMAVDYQAAHPNAKMGGGLDMCFTVDILGDLGLKLPLTGFYTLASTFPSLEKYVAPPDRQYIPQNVMLGTFLPSWWSTYEKLVWSSAIHAPYTSVVYCRLEPNIPSSASVNP
jgi:hypothetical protein